MNVTPTQIATIPNPDELPKDYAYSEDRFFSDYASVPTQTGESISVKKALGHGPLWQGINILAGDLGQLPLQLMQREIKGDQLFTTRDRDSPEARVFTKKPNQISTPSNWKELVMSQAILWGNHVSWIERGADYIYLNPLPPDRVTIQFSTSFTVEYKVKMLDDSTMTLKPEEVFHIQGLTGDGIWGYSLVAIARNVLASGLALQKHGNSVFANGARPSGVLEHPQRLSPEASSNLRSEWNSIHQGTDNMARIAVLQEGMKFAPMSLSNEDAQWLEARRFDREMVASLLNLPAYKLNSLENSSVRANLEEQAREYFNTSLGRWLNRFVEEGQSKILNDRQKRTNYFYKWQTAAFLKGDVDSRYKAYGMALTNRIMNANEVRALEELNPYDGGDVYENPNTSSQNSSVQTAENSQAIQNLVSSQVNHMLEVEANRMETAGRSKNSKVKFLDKAAEFYAEYDEFAAGYLGPVCELVGFDDLDVLAMEHAELWLARMKTAFTHSTDGKLYSNIKALFEDTKKQSEKIVTRILNHGT